MESVEDLCTLYSHVTLPQMSGWLECRNGSTTELPECVAEPLTCDWPQNIRYGRLNYSRNGTVEGSGMAVYKCDANYEFINGVSY